MEERSRCVAGHGGACRAAWQAWVVILGVGVDMMKVSRLDEALRRTPALAARLFTKGERGGTSVARGVRGDRGARAGAGR